MSFTEHGRGMGNAEKHEIPDGDLGHRASASRQKVRKSMAGAWERQKSMKFLMET